MQITLAEGGISDLKVDVLILGLAESPAGPVWTGGSALDWQADVADAMTARLRAVNGESKPGSVALIPAGDLIGAALVVAVGLGRGEPAAETLRRAAGDGLRGLRVDGTVAAALPLPDGDPRPIAEGLLLGDYSFDDFRSGEPSKRPSAGIVVLGRPASASDRKSIAEATTVSMSVHQARDLVNTPPGALRPSHFAERAAAILADTGCQLEVFDERILRKKGYGGIVGVGQGSADPPRLLRMAYRHPKAKKHVALVGKGITFDSGGLSLKTAKGMEWMKADMAGAAAVVVAMAAIGRIAPRVNVTGWAPLAENMPSGSAQRPGDILTMYGGKTVEVLNTDAEGRLVLGDAIVRAAEEEPDIIIDIATLTGAQIVALGPRVAGIMANDADLRTSLHEAAESVGEATWPMPLPPELRSNLDSPVADIANVGGPDGGMLTAGLFLAEFVPEGVPWAHIDIAGPSFNSARPYGYTPKGGTGAGVRTLVEVVKRLADGTLHHSSPQG